MNSLKNWQPLTVPEIDKLSSPESTVEFDKATNYHKTPDMNKRIRELNRKKRAALLAKKCGWTQPFDELPEQTRHAFLSKGSIRMHDPKRGRKGYSRSKQLNGRHNISGNSVKDTKQRIADREYFKEKLDFL